MCKDDIAKRLTYDIKKDFFDEENNICRVMRYYVSKTKDIENPKFSKTTEELYQLLDWNKYRYYDCLYSFWTIFSYGFIHLDDCYKYYITEKGNIKNVYKNGNNVYLGFPQRYMNREATIIDDTNKVVIMFPDIEFLASTYHSIANFYPCHDQSFNKVKMNCGAKDFLCVMVDIIEDCIEQGSDLVIDDFDRTTISIETLIDWKKFLVENRELLCLEEEFKYNTITGKMKGNPLFKGQSIEKPLPETIDEYRECIELIKNRILCRKKLLYRQYLINDII